MQRDITIFIDTRECSVPSECRMRVEVEGDLPSDLKLKLIGFIEEEMYQWANEQHQSQGARR